MAPRELASLAVQTLRGRPQDYVHSWTRYKATRGMSRWHDLLDWVGATRSKSLSPKRSSRSTTSGIRAWRGCGHAAEDSVATSSCCVAPGERCRFPFVPGLCATAIVPRRGAGARSSSAIPWPCGRQFRCARGRPCGVVRGAARRPVDWPVSSSPRQAPGIPRRHPGRATRRQAGRSPARTSAAARRRRRRTWLGRESRRPRLHPAASGAGCRAGARRDAARSGRHQPTGCGRESRVDLPQSLIEHVDNDWAALQGCAACCIRTASASRGGFPRRRTHLPMCLSGAAACRRSRSPSTACSVRPPAIGRLRAGQELYRRAARQALGRRFRGRSAALAAALLARGSISLGGSRGGVRRPLDGHDLTARQNAASGIAFRVP